MNDHYAALFHKHFIEGPADGCWNWQAGQNGHGYGLFAFVSEETKKQKRITASRASYLIYKGPIPDGLHVDHLCGNRLCVNPAHLEAVTVRENNRRSNNFTGVNSRKTHCKRGHEFSPENTFVYQDRYGPKRKCRTCHRLRQRAERMAS